MSKFAQLIAVASIALLAAACGPKARPAAPAPPEIRQAEQLARTLTSAKHLRQSTYRVTMESGKPSELVSFLFSDMGVAEWPDVRGQAPLVHGRPDPRLKAQLVLRGDDTKKEIVAEAYADPAAPPVRTERWPMPEVSKAPRR